MKVLLTGVSGYIGARLLLPLLERGHEVFALVRRKKKFDIPSKYLPFLHLIEGDLLYPNSLIDIPKDLDAAYYLVHSMSDSSKNFLQLEHACAMNFLRALEKTTTSQIIYVSGLSNDQELSTHLKSRQDVERIFKESTIPYTILKAGAIIGSGSASFEIIRDLTEKLPFMITPKWLRNKTEPIGILDVIFYLTAVLGKKECLNQTFEIGCGDQLTYEEMLLIYAKVRKMKRWVIRVPVLTPKLSSYWLYFVTSTNFALARSLVDSLKNETICHDRKIKELIPHMCISYQECIKIALERIEQNHVVSSWKDALSLSNLSPDLQEYINVPKSGCLIDFQEVKLLQSRDLTLAKIWSIGGNNGWYYGDFLWKIRGFIDKLFGGAGLNRGRTHVDKIEMGDAIDFWRVLVADKEKGRLLLYAEMKVPGEAWLEFIVSGSTLQQKATFRPKGILGRLYWYGLFPIHWFIFRGMAQAIARKTLKLNRSPTKTHSQKL